MTPLYVQGMGAVSPAGWGVGPMMEALRSASSLPVPPVPGAPTGHACRVRRVPPPAVRPAWWAQARLRRASDLSRQAMGAALEALGGREAVEAREVGALGLVACTHTACAHYSGRFYGEVLENPETASPMLFPETVINAPASHLAAVLGLTGWVYSVIGDQTAMIQGLRIAGEWLHDGRVEACLVVAMDEVSWMVAEALALFSRNLVLAEGAGALLLSRAPGVRPPLAILREITGSHSYAGAATREAAAGAMQRDLGNGAAGELLVDAACGVPRVDRPEARAWRDWAGARLSPRRVLGEGLCAGTGWQFVAACAALAEGWAEAATVSVVGGNQEAVGARLVRALRTSGW